MRCGGWFLGFVAKRGLCLKATLTNPSLSAKGDKLFKGLFIPLSFSSESLDFAAIKEKTPHFSDHSKFLQRK
jgi:hypothetical protein